MLFTVYWNSYKASLLARNIHLVDTPINLIDLIWTNDRPIVPNNPIYVHALEFTGLYNFLVFDMIKHITCYRYILGVIPGIIFDENMILNGRPDVKN